jgi:hypothetical protein
MPATDEDLMQWLVADELATFAEGEWWARVAGARREPDPEPREFPRPLRKPAPDPQKPLPTAHQHTR